MAVGILAVMFALGTFSSQKAAAAVLSAFASGPVLETSSKTPGAATSVTITGTTDAEITGTDDAENNPDTIAIVLTDFEAAEGSPLADDSEQAVSAETLAMISISDNAPGGEISLDSAVVRSNGTKSVTLTVTLPADYDSTTDGDQGLPSGSEITVVFAEEFGAVLPAIGDPANASIGGEETNTIAYNTHTTTLVTSATAAGAATNVRVGATTTVAIPIGDPIKIGLPGFGVPDSIDESDVLIRETESDSSVNTAVPASVTTSKTTIELLIPDMDLADATASGIQVGSTILVIFQQSAGITIPTTAGTYYATVNGIPDNIDLTADPKIEPDPGNTLLVERSLSLSKTKGSRGTEVTVTGKGYNKDVNSLFVDEDQDGVLDADEITISSTISVDKGGFSHTFTVGDRYPDPVHVNALDISGIPYRDRDSAEDQTWPTFDISGSLSLSKDSVKHGEKIELRLADFAGPTVTEAMVGSAMVTPDPAQSLTGGKAKFEVTIPATGLAIGKQRISVEVGDESATADVTIEGLPLTLSPTSAVPGQEITIRGSGFTPGAALQYIKIDSLNALDDSDPAVLVTGTGNVVANVMIPKLVDGEGDTILVEVKENGDMNGDDEGLGRAGGNEREGVVTMTIPKPTLTLDPTTSRPGSTVTATGTGYVVGANVNIRYGAATTSVNADGTGNWIKSFVVPINTDVPSKNTVTASSGNNTEADKSAEAMHTVPGGTLSVSPTSGPPGTRITITGDGFQAYAPLVELTVGNLEIPHSGVNTDADGDFETTVVLPALPSGTHSLFVGIGGTRDNPDNSESLVFTVGETGPASRTTADVFKDLIDAGNLERVYHYVNATATWLVFDPRPDFAEFNDYTESTSGQAVWVKVTNDAQFQGQSLFAGWNLIVLQ